MQVHGTEYVRKDGYWVDDQGRKSRAPTIFMEDIAAKEAEIVALKTALAAYQSPEAALSLALRAIEESQRANRAEAALAAVKHLVSAESGR